MTMGADKHIVVLCATNRGLRFLQKLTEIAPRARVTVFSFREVAWEPPYFDAIADFCRQSGMDLFEATRVSGAVFEQAWKEQDVDLLFSVNWRYMVPPSTYRQPKGGAYVFHDSLLPKYRGFSPTVWAMLNGENETGVTLFEMAEAVDSGAIVDRAAVPIGPDATIAEVVEDLTKAYLLLLERSLPVLLDGTAPRKRQNESEATYTCRLLPEDVVIDWSAPTTVVYNRIRAYTAPYPGARTTLNGELLHILGASRLPDAPVYVGRVPGAVVDIRRGEGSVVLTGDGALLITSVRRSGAPESADAVLNSLSMRLGR